MKTKECIYCLYLFSKGTDEGDSACAAFPLGIPSEIMLGEISHTAPYPNDGGIRFKEKKIFFKEE